MFIFFYRFIFLVEKYKIFIRVVTNKMEVKI